MNDHCATCHYWDEETGYCSVHEKKFKSDYYCNSFVNFTGTIEECFLCGEHPNKCTCYEENGNDNRTD
jgi:hypothetical protein